MGVVTNSSEGKPEVLFAIHKNFRAESELEAPYAKGNNFKELKDMLIEDIEALVSPMRATREAISEDDVRRVLKDGSDKARAYASKKMADVRAKIGLTV